MDSKLFRITLSKIIWNLNKTIRGNRKRQQDKTLRVEWWNFLTLTKTT